MLTDRAIAYLKPLVFSETAVRMSCILPLGGIYWDDEVPDFRVLIKFPEEDRVGIYNLFRIRFKIWAGKTLSREEKVFWNAAQEKVPDYALFQRLKLSNEDQAAQEQVEKEAEEGFATLFADADKVTVSEKDGFQSFSATFDLTKEDETLPIPKPWWKRLFRG